MTDTIDAQRRSENMRHIKSKNTRIELEVRKIVRELGHTGYRLHRADIPGKPDLAWISRKLAIFVHGCFWHRHDCKEGQRRPKSNQEYWCSKIDRNLERDVTHNKRLNHDGWQVLTIWECELRNPNLHANLAKFLAK